ncbi:hypothetical protein PENTCL1PPCAC_3033, partial [Pristionchus entomophagus]
IMIRKIALLLVAAFAVAAASSDKSTMHIMEGPYTAPPLTPPNNSSIASTATAASCTGFKCAAGDVCMMQAVNCIVAPCYPIPTCVPRVRDGPSCKTIKCAANTTCVDLPTGSVCKPNGGSNSTEDPCATIDCAKGLICKKQTVNCLVAPCPRLAKCVPASTGPSGGSNSTEDLCATVDCAKGLVCKVQTVNCLLPPCPPLAQCVSPSTGPSCITMKCAANTICVELPTGSACQPNGGSNSTTNPCAAMMCAIGSVCQLKTVNCVRAPCPPVAECVPRSTNTSACLTMKCKAGFECRNGDKGETCYPISTPKPDACANHTCPAGQQCSVLMVNCLVAPCPPPMPRCIVNQADSPCNAMECAK